MNNFKNLFSKIFSSTEHRLINEDSVDTSKGGIETKEDVQKSKEDVQESKEDVQESKEQRKSRSQESAEDLTGSGNREEIEKHIQKLDSDNETVSSENFNKLINLKNPSNLTMRDIDKIYEYTKNIDKNKTYLNFIKKIISFVELDTSITDKFIEDDEIFCKTLIEACAASKKSINSLIESTSDNDEKLNNIFNVLTHDSYLELLKNLSKTNIESLLKNKEIDQLDYTTKAFLLNSQLDENTKLDLLDSLLENFKNLQDKALKETVNYCIENNKIDKLAKSTAEKTNKKALDNIASSSLLKILDYLVSKEKDTAIKFIENLNGNRERLLRFKLDQVAKKTDQLVEVTKKSLEFTTSHTLENGEKVISKRSFRRNTNIENKILLADTPQKTLLEIYEHLMDVTKASYAKKIDAYAKSNEFILGEIEKFKETDEEKTEESPEKNSETETKNSEETEEAKTKPEEIPENLNEKLEALKSQGIEISMVSLSSNQEKGRLELSVEEVESISEREYKALLKAKKFAERVLEENAPNAYHISERLNQMGAKLKERIPDTKLGAVTFEIYGEKFVWIKENGSFKGTVKENGKTKENAIIEQIEKIKKDQIDSKEKQKEFEEKTKTKAREKAPETSSEIRRKKLLQYTERFAQKKFQIPEPISLWSEEQIEANWKHLRNNNNVANILENFGIYKESCPKVAAAMISEWSNKEISFEDVVKHAREFPNINLDRKLKKNSSALLEEFEKINAKRSLTATEEEKLSIIFNQILEPSIRLMEEMTKLEYDPAKQEKKEKEPNLTREQIEIRKNISKLFDYVGTPPGSWDEFLAFINGSENKTPVLADMDGNTSYLDQGSAFLRATDQESAYANFINQKEKGLYGINPEGIAILNKDKVTEEVNKLIEYGFIQIYLQERNIEEKTFKSDEKFQKELKKLQIKDIIQSQNFTEEQRRAFQAGYILEEQLKFEKQIDSGAELLKDVPQAQKIFLEKMMEEDMPKSCVQKAKKLFNLMAGGAITINEDTNNVSLDGVGIGNSLDLGKGYTMVIGMTYSPDMPVNPVLGVGYEIYKGENMEFGTGMDIALSGIGAGLEQTAKPGYIDISMLEGLQWNWNSIKPTIGLGVRASWDIEGEIERGKENMKDNTNYKKLWEEWQNLSENATNEKFELLKQDKKAWQTLKGQLLAAGYKIDEIPQALQVKFVEAIEAEINQIATEEASLPIISSVGFGITLNPPYVVPSIGFSLGSTVVTVYNRNEASKFSSKISMYKVDKRMENASLMEEITFIEKTGNMYMDKYGELLVLDQKEKIDFSGLEARNINDYNNELYESELKLIKLPSEKIELKVLNRDYKDFEIHIDPELEELAIIRDGNSIILDGDISGLNISRERFSKPYKPNDERANIMDRIWIGTSSSQKGGRGVEWTLEHEGAYFEKQMNEEWKLENGKQHELGQSNIMQIDGYGENPQHSTKYSDYRVETAGLAPETISTMENNFKERSKLIAQITEKEYGAEMRENLYEGLDKMFENEKFIDEFNKATDQPDKIIKLVYEYAAESGLKNLSEREANTAVVYLLNKFYTTLYDQEKNSGKNLEQINENLKKTVEARLEWYKELLEPEFKKALDKINETEMTAKQAVEKLLTDTYGNPNDLPGKGTLFAKLNDSTFDFTELNTSEIPEGAMLFMGTRKYEDGKAIRALSFTPHYVKTQTEKNLISEYGLLDISRNAYSLTEGSEEDKILARAILEIASPLPEDDLEFLRSPLAMKIANSSAALLLTSPENYKKITEIYEIEEVSTINGYKEAIKEFREIVQQIRTAELNGVVYTKTVNGITVEIDMNAEIVGGSFSKCSNESFYVLEKGKIKITRITKTGTSTFNETTEIVNAKPQKIYAELTTALGIRTVESAERHEEEIGKPRREYREGEGKDRRSVDTETERSGSATSRRGPSRREEEDHQEEEQPKGLINNTGTANTGTNTPSRNK